LRPSKRPDRLEIATNYIRRLVEPEGHEREAIVARTFGSISQEDADATLKAIEECCELDRL
jgi:hypothetical protein